MPPYGTEKVSQGTSTRAVIYYVKKSLTQEKDLATYFNVLIDVLKYIYINILSKIVKEEIEKLNKYIIIKVI